MRPFKLLKCQSVRVKRTKLCKLTTTIIFEIKEGHPSHLVDRWMVNKMLNCFMTETGGQFGHPGLRIFFKSVAMSDNTSGKAPFYAVIH
jgi:hypothetical protein